jgi:hypothetical protein
VTSEPTNLALPQLARHFAAGRGQFSPFSYAIGLDGSLANALAGTDYYPIPPPWSAETIAAFTSGLTALHEIGHLAQYASSTFGLRSLRMAQIAMRYLHGLAPLALPVGEAILQKSSPSDEDNLAMERLLTFTAVADQMRLFEFDDAGIALLGPSTTDTEVSFLRFEPWTPLLLVDGARDAAGRAQLLDAFRQRSLLIHELPHLHFTWRGQPKRLVLNAAALMEAFAFLIEFHQATSALGVTAEALDALPTASTYGGVIHYAISQHVCDHTDFVPTIAILIDVALMYDPFVLHNASPLERPADGGIRDQLPGETFVRAVQAARYVARIKSDDRQEVTRYYNDLCVRMRIPSPKTMVTLARERIDEILSRVPSGRRAFMQGAWDMHRSALMLREADPEWFSIGLLSRDGLIDVLNSAPYVTFYDTETKQPEGFDPTVIDVASIHSLIQQCLVSHELHCPLKQGQPFFCPNAELDEGSLCRFVLPDGTTVGECHVDLFERHILKLSWPGDYDASA